VGDYAVINVTYGRVAAGKALSRAAEILKKQGFTVIGGAEVPAAHCYLREKKKLRRLSGASQSSGKNRKWRFPGRGDTKTSQASSSRLLPQP